MSKKLIVSAVVFAICLATSGYAATIVWVSDNKTPTGGVPADQGWVDLLEANGYTVNLDFRNQEARTLDAAKIDALNAADLIIISRDTNSGDYDDGQEPAQWNSITTPVILQVGHLTRNNRWLWLDTDATNDTMAILEVVESGHPVFNGVTIGADNQIDMLTMGASFANSTDVGNGTLIAKRADNDQIWIAEWQTGQEFYPGLGQIAAGPRLYFASGSDEGTDGRFNLTSEGEKMFLNAVRYMLGNLKQTKARNPEPEDGSLYMDTWVNLGWQAGDSAVSHDVYLGDNFDDVNDGIADTFKGNQAETFLLAGIAGYPYPDGLVPGTTYYWRIDEVNDADPNSPWKGDVWSFTVPSKKAYNAVPVDGSRYVNQDVILNWTAGFDAKIHTVYFGDDFDVVSNAVGGLPQATASYTPESLELDKTYYWRVDEFDGTETYKGSVWSFSTLPDIKITDPNLVAWWKFDEGAGNTALDWSGHNNNADIVGGAAWVDGYDGDALDLDGIDDHVYSGQISVPTRAFTIAFWIKPETDLDTGSPRKDLIFWESVSRPHMTFNRSGNGEIGLWPNIDGDFDGPETMTVSWSAGTWYHITGTFDGTYFRIHVNGNTESSVSHPGENAATTGLFIGCRSNLVNNFNGMLDDVRIYDYALSGAEIKEAMRGDPMLAWNPSPADNSTPNVKDAATLSWQPGNNASQHDVYFGTDENAVADADTSDTTGIYQGRQAALTYAPEGIEWGGGPYYWRIDQYNTDGTVSKGRIWSFIVADFVLIDDFESYDTGDNQIWYAWHDGLGYGVAGTELYFAGNGTGAAIGDETTASYTEETIVHNGRHSMPLAYDNNKQGYAKYSEAEMKLTSSRNWTEDGVAELSLWFYGDPSNAPERMYVAIANSAGSPAVVYYDDPAAANFETWTEWTIPLQAFADQGINLANVDRIAVGLGTRGNMTNPGGSGKMCFDDIRLYRPQ